MEKREIEIRRNVVERALMASRDYIVRHRRYFIYGAAGLLAAIVLAVGGFVYYESREQKELAVFEKILYDYQTSAVASETEKKDLLKKTADELEKVVGSSLWGYVHRNGYYIIGGLYYNEGMFEEAKGYYLKFARTSPGSFFAPLGLQQAARSCEAMEKPAEALEIYKKLEKKYGKSVVADQIFFDLGRLYLKQGDQFKAREYYTRVMNEFPRSPFSQKARERLMLIGLSQAKKP
ncbi:MAG TPA: tetratricopeptide repeat protein [Spirochaetes bacterium]|nr:tetratricopeptide repeat protein [Spirochaetota bacterium]